MGGLVLFWILAPISVLSAAAMLVQRNAVHAALLLIINFFTLALFFLMLGSPFLFVVQIIVYAGAIMVLFLFVIMLLGVDREESLRERIAGQRWLALLLGVGLVAEIAAAIHLGVGVHTMPLPDLARMNAGGNVKALASVLFNRYFFPFEATSALLIVAAIGVVLHGRRHEEEPPAEHEDRQGAPALEPQPDAEPSPAGAQ